MNKTDKVYADKRPQVIDFKFDAKVAEVFPDMIRRSAPGYETITALLGVIAERHVRPNSNIYDLGCSLGAAMLSIHSRISDPTVRLIGVDNSAPMLQECRKNLDNVIDAERFDLLHCDIQNATIENAGMVVLNFTLQFLDPDHRLGLLHRIHAGMQPGGVLVLSEKVCFEDTDEDATQQALHAQFKLANGYSELEIAQKRAALENVMTPDSAVAHLERMHRAGFSRAVQWFQAFNFCSFLACK